MTATRTLTGDRPALVATDPGASVRHEPPRLDEHTTVTLPASDRAWTIAQRPDGGLTLTSGTLPAALDVGTADAVTLGAARVIAEDYAAGLARERDEAQCQRDHAAAVVESVRQLRARAERAEAELARVERIAAHLDGTDHARAMAWRTAMGEAEMEAADRADRAQAQLAALRDATAAHVRATDAWLGARPEESDARDTHQRWRAARAALDAVFADTAAAAEAYTRRVRAETLREAAEETEQSAARWGVASDSAAWLRARADEIERAR